jgi:hypothetical protein
MNHSTLRPVAPRTTCASALATVSLIACGGVEAVAPDAAPIDAAAATDSAPPDALAMCTPNPCLLLSDDFSGATIDPTVWGVATAGGATVTQQNGLLRIHLPPVPEAWADVFSRTTFPVGTTFEASVTFSAGQFYDHKGVGFASARIGSGCDAGESDAAMFRGQDDDGYVETKTGHVATCSLTTDSYPAGPRTLRITRLGDQVLFRQNTTQFPPARTRLSAVPLQVRFSAYTYSTNMPAQPVQIDVDWVTVTTP